MQNFRPRESGGRKKLKPVPSYVTTGDMHWMNDEERLAVATLGYDWDEFGGGFDFDQVLLLFADFCYSRALCVLSIHKQSSERIRAM